MFWFFNKALKSYIARDFTKKKIFTERDFSPQTLQVKII